MATYSSALAQKIPWMEEPGGLQFMGSQRIEHDWETGHEHVMSPKMGSLVLDPVDN